MFRQVHRSGSPVRMWRIAVLAVNLLSWGNRQIPVVGWPAFCADSALVEGQGHCSGCCGRHISELLSLGKTTERTDSAIFQVHCEKDLSLQPSGSGNCRTAEEKR